MAQSLTKDAARNVAVYNGTLASGASVIVNLETDQVLDIAGKPVTVICEKAATIYVTYVAPSALDATSEWYTDATDLTLDGAGVRSIDAPVTGIKITDTSSSNNKIAVLR